MYISAQSIPNTSQTIRTVPIPFAFYSIGSAHGASGIFVGGYPQIGTPVVICQGESTNWYFVSFLVNNLPTLPDFTPGEFMIHADDNTRITVNEREEIQVGSDANNLFFSTTPTLFNNKFQSSYSNNFIFTEASRLSTGIIKSKVLNTYSIFDYEILLSVDYYKY